MRRIIVAAVLFLLVVGTIFLGNIIVNRQCEIMKDEIKNVEKFINNYNEDEALKKINNIKEMWHTKKAIISIFSNHEPLDEITVRIDELACATEIKDANKSRVIAAQILAYIDRITEEQRIHTESFF